MRSQTIKRSFEPVPHFEHQPLLSRRSLVQHIEDDHAALKADARRVASVTPVGSRAFGRVPVHRSSNATIQAKLVIGEPDDEYEKEADRIADEVMRMPDPQTQQACTTCDEEEPVQMKPLAEQITSLAQRQAVSEEDEEEEPIQAKREITLQRETDQPEDEEDKQVQAKRTYRAPLKVSTRAASLIQGLRGGGRPLNQSERDFFEPRFGLDFGDVAVHAGFTAAQAAAAVNARAFTMGENVVFGTAEIGESARDRRQITAHELVHVIQQQAAGPRLLSRLVGSPVSWHHDHRAVHAGGRSAGRTVSRTFSRTTQRIQRREGLRLRRSIFTLPSPELRLLSPFTSWRRHFVLRYDQAGYLLPRFGELSKLQTVAEILLSDPNFHVVLEGHASAEGSKADNQRLSENRVEAVKRFLIGRSISESRITTRAFGETQLAVQETARRASALEEQRRMNRRVEVYIVRIEPLQMPRERVRLLPTPEELRRILTPSESERLNRELQRFLRTPIPPGPRGRTPKEMFRGLIDDHFVNPLLNRLGIRSPEWRRRLRDGIHTGIEKGLSAGLNAAMDGAGIGSTEQDAIRAVVRSLANTRPGEPPTGGQQ